MTEVSLSSWAAWSAARSRREPLLNPVLLRGWPTTPCTESPDCCFWSQVLDTQHRAWIQISEGIAFVSSSPDLRITPPRDELLCQQAWEKALAGCHPGSYESSHPLQIWKWNNTSEEIYNISHTFFHQLSVDYVFRVKAADRELTKTQFLPLKSSKSSGGNRKETQKSQKYGYSTGNVHRAFLKYSWALNNMGVRSANSHAVKICV